MQRGKKWCTQSEEVVGPLYELSIGTKFKSVTLNDLERRNRRYIALFH